MIATGNAPLFVEDSVPLVVVPVARVRAKVPAKQVVMKDVQLIVMVLVTEDADGLVWE